MSRSPKRRKARAQAKLKPHDALFKDIFEQPELAAVELRALLPPAIAQRADWSTLRVETIEGRLQGEQTIFCDIHYSLTLRSVAERDSKAGIPEEGDSGARVVTAREGKAGASEELRRDEKIGVYVLLEHQSESDRFMAFRVLQGMVSKWSALFRARQELPWPVILPLVVHHSEGGWRASRRFSELLDPHVTALPGVQSLIPDFEYLLDDVSLASNEELLRRAQAVPELYVPLALLALRDGRNRARALENLPEFAHVLAQLQRNLGKTPLQLRIFSYLAHHEISIQDVQEAIATASEEEKETVTSLAEQLHQMGWNAGIEQGIEQGLEQGLEQGIEKGRALALRRALAQMLVRRFGPLDEVSSARLESATVQELEIWFERSFDVESIEAVMVLPSE